jgi:hypothetical protein
MSQEKPSLLEQMIQATAEHESLEQPGNGDAGQSQEPTASGPRKIDTVIRKVRNTYRRYSRKVVFALSGLGSDVITVSGNAAVAGKYLTAFPKQAIVGSLGEVAVELSKGTEVPEEFIFATALTCLASIVSGELKLKIGLDSDTRLYTVLLGTSHETKKSSAMKRTITFFQSIKPQWTVIYGAGSAEGLGKELNKNSRILLAYDELRAFIDKTNIKASVLLPMATSLFENYSWDNPTKDRSLSIRNARLSLVGCCTTGTYEHLWTSEAIAIGLINRLFVVDADAKPRIAWPTPPDEDVLATLRARIQGQLAQLPLCFDVTPDAKTAWENWYCNHQRGEHSRRLDTIGFRLIPLIALTMDKEIVDQEVVEIVTAILGYELNVRMRTDPIDADGLVAKLEEAIRRTLKARGPLPKRSLQQIVHAHRYGIWVFDSAIQNLIRNEDIMLEDGVYSLLYHAGEAA